MSNQSTFKKSVLSIVIVSAISGGLVAFDKYQKKVQEVAVSRANNDIVEMSQASKDIQELARIAQENKTPDIAVIEQVQPKEIKAEILEEKQITATSQLSNVTQKPLKTEVIESQLLFAVNSSEIAPSYLASLNKTAAQMQADKTDKQQVWQVIGFADPSGNDEYNQKLAKKRAQVVADFLVSKGVNKDQLMIVSLGESQAPKSILDKDQNQLQRRVEIHAYQAEVATLAKQLKTENEVTQTPQNQNNNKPEDNLLGNTAEPKTITQQTLLVPQANNSLSVAMEL